MSAHFNTVRTDFYDSKYLLKLCHRLIIIVVSLCLNVDSAILFSDLKASLYSLQVTDDIGNQLIFKNVSIFSLDCNFSILDQKS